MPTLLLTDHGAHLVSFAPSLFGGSPRFVSRQQASRGRFFGNGVRFSDEGDIDLIRLATRPVEAVERTRGEAEPGALAEIVARHLVAKSAHRPRPFAPRPSNAELASRFAAHLATVDGTTHPIDTVVAWRRVFTDGFGADVVAALNPPPSGQRNLVDAVALYAPGPTVVTGPYWASVVHRDGTVDAGAPSQAAGFAAGLAPSILKQLAVFAGVPEALADGFDDVALAIALGRVEDRVRRALLSATPCLLGGAKAPLFVAPDLTHFALPTALQAALDEAEAKGVALSGTLTTLLAARRKEQARVLLAAQKLAAFEAELRLPPLDTVAEWFKKSSLFEALSSAQSAQRGDDPLFVLGRDRALFDLAGKEGIRLRPLSTKWLRPLLEDVGETAPSTPAREDAQAAANPPPGAADDRLDVAPSSAPSAAAEMALDGIDPAPGAAREDSRAGADVERLPVDGGQHEPLGKPTATFSSTPAAPSTESGLSSGQTADNAAGQTPDPAPALGQPSNQTLNPAPVPEQTLSLEQTAAPVREENTVPPASSTAVSSPTKASVTPLPAGALKPLPVPVVPTAVSLPLFRDPHRVAVFGGFDFDSLKITVDDVVLKDAKERVGRLHQGLAASVPEARAGALVWVEGNLSFTAFDAAAPTTETERAPVLDDAGVPTWPPFGTVPTKEGR